MNVQAEMSRETFVKIVKSFVAVANATAQALVAEGKLIPHTEFGYTLGPKHARIFAIRRHPLDGTVSKTVRVFLGVDGLMRRADGWKASGRIINSFVESENTEAVVSCILGGMPAGTLAKHTTKTSDQESYLSAMGIES